MTALALDAAQDILSVALKRPEGEYYFQLDAGLRHSERLMELADYAFRISRSDPSELDLVACMKGPGSFTGLRIGMSCAKGIAVSLGIPLIAVPTLDCIAYPCSAWPGLVVPIMDAKQKRWYCAVYSKGTLISGYMDSSASDLIALIGTLREHVAGRQKGDLIPILLTGPDAGSARKELSAIAINAGLGPDFCVEDPDARRGNATALLRSAIGRYEQAGEAAAEKDGDGIDYLRKSEAELTLEMKKTIRKAPDER